MPDDDKSNGLVSRISVSLPPALLEELDSMVDSRGYGSRTPTTGTMALNGHTTGQSGLADECSLNRYAILAKSQPA